MSAKTNLVLTGFMGTGKTEVGKLVALKAGLLFADSDDKIEEEEGMSISAIFSSRGEEYFRNAEARVIFSLSKLTGAVISTGGGAVLRRENIRNLEKNGLVFALYASPGVILQRVGKNSGRPLLDVPDPLEKIKELLSARLPLYRASGRLIDTSELTIEETAGLIVRLYNEQKDN